MTGVLQQMAHFNPRHQQKIAKKCGHGCVVCGQLIATYHRTGEYADTYISSKGAADAVLLCIQHWQQLQTGALTKEQLEAAVNAPFNLQKNGAVIKPLTSGGNILSVTLGHITLYSNYTYTSTITSIVHAVNNNSFIEYNGGNTLQPLTVDQTGLLAINILDKRIRFSIILYNHFNELLLSLEVNVVKYAANSVDCRITGETLFVTQNDTPLLQLKYDKEAGNATVTYARFQLNGVQCVVQDGTLLINGEKNPITDEELATLASHGIIIGAKQEFTPCVKHLEKLNRVHA